MVFDFSVEALHYEEATLKRIALTRPRLINLNVQASFIYDPARLLLQIYPLLYGVNYEGSPYLKHRVAVDSELKRHRVERGGCC